MAFFRQGMLAGARVTQVIIIINVLAFVLQGGVPAPQGQPSPMFVAFALWPLNNNNFQVWQLVTYSFLHGGTTHLLFNMLALFMFGSDLERVWGGGRFLAYYLTCVVSAAIVQLVVAAFAGGAPTVGASGGVFGLLIAFGMMYPRRMIMLLFPPIPMPAWLFVTLYGALELFLGLTGAQAGVAHFAHLGGMAGGFIVLQFWKGWKPSRPRY